MTTSQPQAPEAPARGHLYLIPTPLGRQPDNRVLPEQVIETVHSLDTFFVERIRQANSFLRWIRHPVPDFRCRFYELNKHTPGEDLIEMLSLLKQGARAGIISEAGCPSVADPGAELVRLAHQSGIPVTPLVGPSSILLAVMGSGLNGQAFTFHGYLPRPGAERTEAIRRLQNESDRTRATQVFMETPYRNNDLLQELLRELRDDTLLCTASNLTLDGEQIITKSVAEWRKTEIDLDHSPSIFLLLSETPRDGRGSSKGKRQGRNGPGKKKPAREKRRVRK
ncbi:SAM-dependent methyltransferase [Balneolales bacterium ANBcel1]|nr:SAM-dependent methyltransferase [Balneolales bacterium ANBcel1]